MSDFTITFNCFKAQDLIFNIIISIHDADALLLLSINSLYSVALVLAFSISETT